MTSGPTWQAGPSLKSTTAFGANPGGLEMLSYRPGGLAPGAPLVVVLHGCGQSAADYASCAGWLTLADRMGFAVLAPQQTAANNPNRCFNWFSSADIHRGEGEVASIAAMVAFMVRGEKLDPRRVFVTGLSAGGAMTMVMLAAYPDLFAGGAVIAGLPYGIANGVMQAMTAMQQGDQRSPTELARLVPQNLERYPRLTVWHGGADHVVSPDNAEAIARQWAAAQGLSPKPDRAFAEAGRSRGVWLGNDGKTAIELNLIRGLGHGVPLSTRGDEGLGRAAPYMLEAGVSSSEEIAAFWGLSADAHQPSTRTAAANGLDPVLARPPRASVADATKPAPSAAPGLGDRVLASVNDHVPSEVRDVIATALKQAGLLR